MESKREDWAWAAAPLTLVLLAATGCDSTSDAGAKPTAAPSSTPVARVCANPAAGPAKAPAGAVTVDPAVVGDLAAKTKSNPPNTTFWLRPGKHRLDPDRYAQVIPKKGNSYVAAPGAVLDGRKTNQYAFGGSARNVTIRHLTVQGFVAPHDEGVVNHDSADGWVIEHATIQNNSGAGLMAGARQRVRAGCLRDDGQYGMNAYKATGRISGLVVEDNEVVGNNTGDWERRREGCGCTGGIKFWAVDGADVRGNWVHDNRGTGLWADSPANTSSGDCTLLVKDTDRCAKPAIATAPLYADCRWKTQRVDIHDNRFMLDKSVVECTAKCDRMAVLANYGTYPDWSPYQGERVAEAITHKQHNRWHDNVYAGPWKFVAHDPSRVLDFGQWQSKRYRQDAGSTLDPRAGG